MHIRQYGNQDIPALETMMSQLQEHFSKVDMSGESRPFRSADDVHEYMAKMIADVDQMDGALYVAEDGGRLVGFVQGIINHHSEPDVVYDTTHECTVDGWIGLLFVEPEQRGKHIGSDLLAVIKKYFTEKGCQTLRLLVVEDNAGPLSFYKHHGLKTHDIEMAMQL